MKDFFHRNGIWVIVAALLLTAALSLGSALFPNLTSPLSNAIGGLIKFGAGGVGEIIADRASSGQQAFETQRNKVHQTLQGILAGNTNLTDDELILLSDPQFSNTIKKTLTKELIMQTIMDSRPELGKIMEQYFYNPDKFERAEIIKMILERQ